MNDPFGNTFVPRDGTVVTQLTDGIVGGTLDFSESLYADATQTEIGWPALHLYPLRHDEHWDGAAAEEFYRWWLPRSLPSGCGCSSHWKEVIEIYPPRFTTAGDMFEWANDSHNAVNAKLNRDDSHPHMPLDAAYAIWSRIATAGPVAWWTHTPTPVVSDVRQQRLVITVAVNKSREWLRITEPRMRRYADSVGADFVALTNATQGWWGLEKFRVKPFAEAYDHTLFLDADILITDDAPDLFELMTDDAGEPIDVLLHNDRPHLLDTQWIYPERRRLLRTQGLGVNLHSDSIHRYPTCLNSGLILTSRAGAVIWSPPKLPIPTSHCAEQFWIEHQVWRGLSNGLRASWSLPQSANHQYWMVDWESRIDQSHFLHLANHPQKLDALRELQDRLVLKGR